LNTESIFTPKIISEIENEIKNAEGNEVYFIGKLDFESSLIDEYELRARGNSNMAPALLTDIEPGNIIFHNHPSGDLTPSGADIRVASHVGDKGIGFAIIDNSVGNVYIVVEPKIPAEITDLATNSVVNHFLKEGELAENLNDYEYREEQVKVVKEVIQSFNSQKKTLIEAGTGTGKSFAYLIPSLYWAYQNNELIVVSTNTINLQEQLIEKDLVLLKKVLPFSFKAVLVKGRSNYICKRKLNRFKTLANENLFDDDKQQIQFQNTLQWLEEADTGTRSEMNFKIDNKIWEKICSETDLCLGANCPYFDKCYFMQARKEIYSADLLVANHHLLLSDAKLKYETGQSDRGVLPKFSHLIVDEAHNFGEVATHHLGKSFYFNSLNKYLDQLHDKSYSVISTLRNEISETKIKGKKDLFSNIDQRIIPQIQRVRDLSQHYYTKLDNFFENNTLEHQLRLTDEVVTQKDWEKIYNSGDELIGYLSNLTVYLNYLYEDLVVKDVVREELSDILVDLEAVIGRGQKLTNYLDFNLKVEDKEYVFWLEKKGKSKVSQRNAPLDNSKILPDLLWDTLDNLVLTSATLTADNDFDYFLDSYGLQKSQTLQIESPFDYENQAVLAIPHDIPPANSPDFLKSIEETLADMLISYNGSTMVLFTSYKMLNYCLHKMEGRLNQKNLTILPQGRYPRHYIINTFKEKSSQIIFGTVSFWEGIDIKGDDLRYLLMMKLPFPVPSEPVAAARSELMRKNNINPFFNYSLPRAVIRFKQGFGRLIRSRRDRGMVVVFDNRLLKKSYGQAFLNSLPKKCPVKRVKKKSLIRKKKNKSK
jgi:ATP-dependent DNA helicase DinG